MTGGHPAARQHKQQKSRIIQYVLIMDLLLEQAAIITQALQDAEWRLGKQADLITHHRDFIVRLRKAGFLKQNADEYSLNAKGYRKFRHLAPKQI